MVRVANYTPLKTSWDDFRVRLWHEFPPGDRWDDWCMVWSDEAIDRSIRYVFEYGQRSVAAFRQSNRRVLLPSKPPVPKGLYIPPVNRWALLTCEELVARDGKRLRACRNDENHHIWAPVVRIASWIWYVYGLRLALRDNGRHSHLVDADGKETQQ